MSSLVKSSQRAVNVELKRFWCDSIPFIAYRLPNGEIVMSQTQSLPNTSKVLQKIADEFIRANQLCRLSVTLPNRRKIVVYPLSTITALWRHLLTIEQMPVREKLLAALQAGTPIVEDNEQVLALTRADFVKRVEQAPKALADVVKVQVEELELSFLIEEGKTFLCDYEGLAVIDAPVSWLLELNPAQKKARMLKYKGFSFQQQLVYYQDQVVFEAKTHCLSDWLVVWDYFVSKGNTKALSLLRNLAYQGVSNRVG